MITILLKTVFLSGLMLSLFSFDFPNGWLKGGDMVDKYEMGIDVGSGRNGKNAATIKSIDNNIQGFGTLMQNSLPNDLAGHRVKMTGYIKSKDVKGWAGLWLRVDNIAPKEIQTVEFDNMEGRPISGTNDWKKYEIVLDIPVETSHIAFGALLSGTGQIWFQDLKFEVVEKSVASTSIQSQKPIPHEPIDATQFIPSVNQTPTNLAFEK